MIRETTFVLVFVVVNNIFALLSILACDDDITQDGMRSFHEMWAYYIHTSYIVNMKITRITLCLLFYMGIRKKKHGGFRGWVYLCINECIATCVFNPHGLFTRNVFYPRVHYYRSQGKVMFSQACVILSTIGLMDTLHCSSLLRCG